MNVQWAVLDLGFVYTINGETYEKQTQSSKHFPWILRGICLNSWIDPFSFAHCFLPTTTFFTFARICMMLKMFNTLLQICRSDPVTICMIEACIFIYIVIFVCMIANGGIMTKRVLVNWNKCGVKRTLSLTKCCCWFDRLCTWDEWGSFGLGRLNELALDRALRFATFWHNNPDL